MDLWITGQRPGSFFVYYKDLWISAAGGEAFIFSRSQAREIQKSIQVQSEWKEQKESSDSSDGSDWN